MERICTQRLVLRRPVMADAEAIFIRYASDREVTRYLAWPRHRSVEDTREFLEFSDACWEQWGTGPYLIELRSTGRLLGSTGIALENARFATTGYVLARDAWGQGYATEALQAMVALAAQRGIQRLDAQVHVANAASIRVLEKCAFVATGQPPHSLTFPNLESGASQEAISYTRAIL
ncbi:MAG TPA: GNAT family N-acetyltransferase [Steroidobacteraceae bacterium]